MKIGLDIDGVLCNFVQGVFDKAREMGIGDKFPATWLDVDNWFLALCRTDAPFLEVWPHIKGDIGFWLKLQPLPYSLPLDFTPDYYITSRPIEQWVTEQWLKIRGFPCAPVITVAKPLDKLEHIQEHGLDLFIDDHWETVRHLRENGVNALLYEAPYQRGHDIGDLPKIKHLSEVKHGD